LAITPDGKQLKPRVALNEITKALKCM